MKKDWFIEMMSGSIFLKLKRFFTKHFKYLSYVLRHKWYVLQESWKLGIFWLGVTHDLSKFSPSEWFPYAENFYGEGEDKKKVDEKFCRAWLHHIHNNPHHWQHHILHLDNGRERVLDMPEKHVREMVADWKGAGKAQGHGKSMMEWFDTNRHKHQMSYKTKLTLYELLKRSDLLLQIILKETESSRPYDVVKMGVALSHIVIIVRQEKDKEECLEWFDDMKFKGLIPRHYTLSLYSKDSPYKPEVIWAQYEIEMCWTEFVFKE